MIRIIITNEYEHTLVVQRGYPAGGAPDKVLLELDGTNGYTVATEFDTAEFKEFIRIAGLT